MCHLQIVRQLKTFTTVALRLQTTQSRMNRCGSPARPAWANANSLLPSVTPRSQLAGQLACPGDTCLSASPPPSLPSVAAIAIADAGAEVFLPEA
jgi:hypothetical protein